MEDGKLFEIRHEDNPIHQVRHADAADTAIPEREFAVFKIIKGAATKRERLLITNDVARMVKAGAARIQCVPLVLFLLDLQ